MTNPTLLTVILNYQTPELTLKATKAALREMDGVSGEIVIVDNDSQDGSFELIAKALIENGWDRDNMVRVLQSGHNGGFGAGNNVAIRAGLSNGKHPDFIYILNSDAWPEPGAIRVLHDYLRTNPKTGMAGSHVQGEDAAPHRTAFRFPSIASEFEAAVRTGIFSRLLKNSIVALPVPKANTKVDWVAGASLMMRRKMLDEIGLFDEAFFLYFEETDLCRRAANAGWSTVYVPESAVVHIGSASTGMKTWSRTPTYWFDSRLRYFNKNHGVFYTVLATLARISGLLIWQLRRLVSDKPQSDPDNFLLDLIVHSAKEIIPGRTIRDAHRVQATVMEDSK